MITGIVVYFECSVKGIHDFNLTENKAVLAVFLYPFYFDKCKHHNKKKYSHVLSILSVLLNTNRDLEEIPRDL